MDEEDRLDEIREAAESRFFYFARYVLALDKLNDYHAGLCDWMQKRSHRRALVLWPRGTYKSTISLAFILWKIIHNPEERILIACSTSEVARDRLKVLKGWMERSPLLKGLWPHIFWKDPAMQAPEWTDRSVTVRRKGNWAEATIEAGGVEVNIVGKHYTGSLLDDLVVKDTVDTEKAITKTIDYFRLLRPVYVAAGASGEGFWEVIDGTRWNDSDLYGWLLENDKGVKTNIRGIWTDETESETILGKELPRSVLEQIRATMTAYQFSCQYLNTPISSDTAMFKEDDIRPFRFDGSPPSPCITTVTMDPARKAGKAHDRTAIVARCVSQNNHWYVEKAWAGRLLLAGRSSRLFDFCFDLETRGYKPSMVGIEDPDGLEIQSFKEAMARNGHWWTVMEIKHRGRTKESRVAQIQHIVENHRLHLRASQTMLEQELYRFPYARFDDLADALAMHYELPIGHPSQRKPTLPYLSPDAIAARHQARVKGEGLPADVGFQYKRRQMRVEESYLA